MIKTNNSNIIYGNNAVREAFQTNRVLSIYIAENFTDKAFLDIIQKCKTPVSKIHIHELDNMCKGVHQGIAAKCKPYEYHSLEEVIKKSKNSKEHPVFVILDGINDPHNMGAILRSCDVFNVSAVIISKHNQVPLNDTVAKTSAGAINYVPVVLVSNLNQTIDILKSERFWIVSTDGSATLNYNEIDYDFPTALVVGSEGNGVSKLVLKNSDYVVKIPQFGHVNSLNASVAAGIMLSRIRHK